jgi:spermidine/putrescine transport system permease protein
MKHRSLFKRSSLSILFLWLGLFALASLALMLVTSFLQHTDSDLFVFKFTLENYSELFDYVYFRILCQSLSLAAICTGLCLVIGYPAAYVLAQIRSPLKPLLLILFVIPFWTSSLIRTYAMLAILKTHGVLNTLLLSLGWIHQPTQILYTNTAVLIGSVYNLLPFMILPLYSTIEKMDLRLLEAARDLGANRLRLFRSIIIPLSMPGIVAGCLLVFLPTMTLFYIPVLLGGAKSLLIGNLIQNQFLAMRNWPGGAATSIMLTAFLLLLILIFRHFSPKDKQSEDVL